MGAASDEQFEEIFRRVAGGRSLKVDQDVVSELIVVIRDTFKQELRGCYPRDLVNQVCWKAEYEGREPCLDRAALMNAVRAYFLAPQ
jgi:hypothetical protein